MNTSIAAFTLAAALAGGVFGYEVSETKKSPYVNCPSTLQDSDIATRFSGMYKNDGLEHGCVSGMGVNVFIDVDQSAKPEAASVAHKIGQDAQQQLFDLWLMQSPAPR